MDDYKNLIVEYKSLQFMIETQINDLNLIQAKFKSFINNISSLKDDISKIPDIPNGSFGFLNPLLKSFSSNLQKNINDFNDIILNQIDNFIYSFKFATTKNLTQFNEIKNDLYEEKKILISKRDAYFDYLNEYEESVNHSKSSSSKNIFFKWDLNNNDTISKKDENVFNNAVKENYFQLYQYELNKMNDVIEECNNKYNNIYYEINAINASLKMTVRDCLLKFANNLTNFSQAFNTLADDIINKINSLKILKNEEISQSVDKVTSSSNKPRFDKENLEKFVKTKKEKNTEKKTLFQFFTKKATKYI